MLARSFLNADQLNIPQDWYEALLKVYHAMERGELKYVSEIDMKYSDFSMETQKFSGLFNMAEWRANVVGCGTVCCIGGTAELLGKVDFGIDCHSEELENLFYPPNHDDYNHITVEQAQEALRRYLTIGAPQWEYVLGGAQQ